MQIVAKRLQLTHNIERRNRVACTDLQREQMSNETDTKVSDCEKEEILEGSRCGAELYKAMSRRTCVQSSANSEELVSQDMLSSYWSHATGLTSSGRSQSRQWSEDVMRHYGRHEAKGNVYPAFTSNDFTLSLVPIPQLYEGVPWKEMDKIATKTDVEDEEAFHVFWACTSAFAGEIEAPEFSTELSVEETSVSCGHAWSTHDIDPRIFCPEEDMTKQDQDIDLRKMIRKRGSQK